jgi:hypothetical protein
MEAEKFLRENMKCPVMFEGVRGVRGLLGGRGMAIAAAHRHS